MLVALSLANMFINLRKARKQVMNYCYYYYYYYYYYYLKEEREASTYEAKKCQSPPGIEPGTCVFINLPTLLD